MEVYAEIVERIIKQQESIIGPLAVEQAGTVSAIKINDDKKVTITGDGAKAIDALVEKYKELFGQISVEVCKEAASSLIDKLPEGKHPKSLE